MKNQKMTLNARNATPADFDKTAQKCANAFWFWGIIAAVIAYFFGWWGAIPGALALLSALNSVMATRYAAKLRQGESTTASAKKK